jgi:hypothetical protein
MEDIGSKLSFDHLSKWVMRVINCEESAKKAREFTIAYFTHAQYLNSGVL